jgi:threonine dehydrogenase-like Zn-dependent dehydrogenase
MVRSLDLQRKGLVDPSVIITHEVSLSEMDRALEIMGSAERIKVVVTP